VDVRGASFLDATDDQACDGARLPCPDGFCLSAFGDHGRPVGVWDTIPGQWDIVPMIPDVCATVSAALSRLGSCLRPFDAGRSGLTPRSPFPRLLNLRISIS
jgi:hypothetical protein